MAKIELVNVCKTFQARRASLLRFPFPIRNEAIEVQARRAFSIQNLNLTIPHAKTMVILGPSGCGKTTLLNTVSGVVRPAAGTISFAAQRIDRLTPPASLRWASATFRRAGACSST
jgi:ABC-type sugar transport system ATPase subunit